MKDRLILKKYETESVYGTFNLEEEPSFFGSKVIEVEDEIIINDSSIQYFQYFDENDPNNGFQYYELDLFFEQLFLLDLVNLKKENHTISKFHQNKIDDKFNTRWIIEINTKNILKEYLFAKIKERRTFKTINHNLLRNKNINESIYLYITKNILDRYKFDKIDFFVKYDDIKDVSQLTILKKYDPIFKNQIQLVENKVENINVEINNFIDPLSNLKVNYSQIKPSTDYKFDYYFNIYYKKI
jgi:hypothetical protein